MGDVICGSTEVQTAVNQLHITLFGVEQQGGLVRAVEKVDARLVDVEKRVSSISAKWLVMCTLAGMLGNAIGARFVESLSHFVPLLK